MSKENQDVIKNDIFTWIEEELKPEFCTSENFIYNEMESQSDYSLPVIYQDFDDNVRFEQVSVSFLVSIKELIIKAQVCKTVHPSGKTWSSWLKEAGFRKVLPTYSGGSVAYKLFDTYTEYDRPSDLKSVDDAIKKVVKIVTELEAPIELDPMITAVK
ncbi:hypothetical protein DFR55_10850 [Herbinix hemicellulosilytica]|uniref:Uncharacterized protein n=1 Tax=Herbinix hemicellulosilytica TaxID=1564487 RepID=A0A0H5SG22_HERHM|nr:hypothetical protein [Herbinix hemicellulosilytica]RBP58989.1 hypothetical protein DFR55_10850 [Herbinix hemicellulosilytica]CRZ33985.1 hypothetical protein HHT355_0782 [Herbinix hemicellulosilytica]